MGLLLPHGRCCGRNGAPHQLRGAIITNRIAIYLAAIIVILIAIDGFAFDWAGSHVMAGKFLVLIDWIKFWR